MRFVDLSGKEIDRKTPCIARKKLEDGAMRLYRKHPSDVAALVEQLRAAGETNPHFLNANFWLNSNCSMSDGNCGGDCPANQSCTKVFTTGGFETCVCKSNS